ncbi:MULTISPECIES: IclR family transcriptional regulator [Acinetobacter]|uniref:IclR family transcriptional regulator n=1 Tax=Acinetobacter TaxID=469 RepID=UPI0022E57017|nr:MULTISPECIES: IclR family transcriptional regulator C-terminal domain-containing protein [Acinetobacter]MDI1223049.1 IclR family transcriptional regulator C-terminal domain-containing protein [Acinetobacter sp.]
MSTSNNMLNILTLFSIEEPVLDADIICEKLNFSKPTGYRYIKDLVSHGILQRLHGGQYTFGPRISVMDYISQQSNPILRLSIPFMLDIVEQTEFNCCLTQFYEDYCIDIHHEGYKESSLLSYGRGRPRPAYAGAAPKIILANTTTKVQKSIFRNFQDHYIASEFALTETEFLDKLNQTKKQGYYVSKGELETHLGAIAVPIIYSNKAFPLALSIVGSVKRFNLIQVETIVEMLTKAAKHIESEFKKTES